MARPRDRQALSQAQRWCRLRRLVSFLWLAQTRTKLIAYPSYSSNGASFNPDSLSSARTTAGPSGLASITPPTGSPLRSSLSRSHAIRVRVPISNAHPASSISAESPADSYDRFRHDASDFARRVRQRYGDPSASDSTVVTSLARAGYGSGFATEPHEEESSLSSGREVVGR